MRDRGWWLVLALGLALRVAAPFVMDVWEDGGEYAAMGRSFAEDGTFTLPSGEDRLPGGADGQPTASHHYPPAWPVVLGAGYKLLGFGAWQTKLVSLVAALASVAVAWACTRDLLGARAALVVAALVAVEDQLLWAQGRGYSESLVLVFFTLTVWAILRSLKDARFVLLAGLFAGFAYLTRASMGPFFLVAGGAGLAWRLMHRGWRGVLNPWYLAAAALFAGIVAAWAARNVAAHGWPRWETSAHVAAATDFAFAHPKLLALGLLWKFLLFAAFLAAYALPLHRELRQALLKWRDEETSALLLAGGLVFLLGWLLTALLWGYEGFTPWFVENQRYVVVALVPLAWLALREARDDKGLAVLAVLLVAASLATVAGPMRDAEVRAAELLEPHLQPGDAVGIQWFSLYSLSPELRDAKLVPVARIADERPEFVLSTAPQPPDGYALVWEVHQRTLTRGEYPIWVYAREDVAAARGLPRGDVVWRW